MMLTSLAIAPLLAIASLLSANPVAPSPAVRPGITTEEHGKLDWFQGSFEEALAQAKTSNKLVFVDFWTTWCGWCKKLNQDTFSDDSVVALMKDFVCVSMDAESTPGRPLARRFHVKGFPALILLAADGTPEDAISGYLPPDKFKQEIRRIRSGQGTVGEFRKQVAADRTDLEARYRLAQKLGELGDDAARDAGIAEIRKLDPDGKSLTLHRIAFEDVIAKITAGYQKDDQNLDTGAMVAFLAKESYPELIFKGNASLGQMHAYLAKQAEGAGNATASKQHGVEMRSALKAAWAVVPESQLVDFGNSVAWAYYEARESLSPADKAFALEVAQKVVQAAPENASAIDTYACCLFINGRKDEAQKQIARCIELDPKNGDWKDRLAEFQK
jgi:thioredoxin-like negative regulator of GroEL